MVDAKTEYGFRLTAQAPDTTDPVLYPGWRGQNDDWAALAAANNLTSPYSDDAPKTNLAIKGLFEQISEAEGEKLVAEGWKKVEWGLELAKYEDDYLKYLFYDYDYVSAPIYLWPYTANIVATGGFVNGYGFQNE